MKLDSYISPKTYRQTAPTSSLIAQVTPLAQTIVAMYRGEVALDTVSVVYALMCAQAISNGRLTRAVTPLSLRHFMEEGDKVTAIPRRELLELSDAVLDEREVEPTIRHSVIATYAIVEAYLNRKVFV